MNFERSTQAKSWIFDHESLQQCKEEASRIQCFGMEGSNAPKSLVRKFACGFQQPVNNGKSSIHLSEPLYTTSHSPLPNKMASSDQEILVHFHSHQIQRLVGPNAIYPELRRSASVLSTAIMLFRRFYLSNSVIDFHPRDIAAASALLAVKVDCEPRLEIALLSHATYLVNLKAKKAVLCREELRAVSIEEIEEAERALLEGLDFRLRCHHPYGAIHLLASEVAESAAGYTADSDLHKSAALNNFGSPRGINALYEDDRLQTLSERALAISQSALVYSDVNFLYPPGKIAFATVAIALEGGARGARLGFLMRNYLRVRFPHKENHELSEFEQDVIEIIREIEGCQEIDLGKFFTPADCRFNRAAQHRAFEVRRVFSVAAHFRRNYHTMTDALPSSTARYTQSRKRRRTNGDAPFTRRLSFTTARVTPTHTPFF